VVNYHLVSYRDIVELLYRSKVVNFGKDLLQREIDLNMSMGSFFLEKMLTFLETLTYIEPEPYLRRRLCTTLASLRNVRSAMSAARSNFGGFILNSASKDTLRS
jgi:hypothetical protein